MSVLVAATTNESRAAHRRGAPVFLALVALAVLAPLPFGAYPTWAWSGMAAACGVLTVCWGMSAFSGRIPVVTPPAFLSWAAAAMGLALLWGLLQTGEFMPESWRHPIWRDAAAALATPDRGTISLDPAASRESVLRMASYACVFWLAFQYGQSSRCADLVLRAVALGSACYALYGLGVVFSGAESILWFEKTDYAGSVTGTFVNPNSFGAYCGIGLICSTAAILRRFSGGSGRRLDFRERLRFMLVEFAPQNVLLLSSWLVLASALLLSLSRGATASTALAIMVLLSMLDLRGGFSLRGMTLRLFGAALTAGLLMFLAGEALERRLWEIGPDFAGRAEIYSQTLEAMEQAPLLGTGLGTFEAVYRSHRTADVRPGVAMAHNDYLELALELGIPAAALLVSAVAILAAGCARGVWARRRDFEFPAAGVAVCVLAGAHSLVDFSLQIPAFAATFSLVLGVSAAQSVSTGRRAFAATPVKRLFDGRVRP